MVVVGTVTPDRQFPSCACLVQEKIGARQRGQHGRQPPAVRASSTP